MTTHRKKYLILTLFMVFTLILMNTYILLDAFVLTKIYVSFIPIDNSNQSSSNSEAISTSNTYQDENIMISIETVNEIEVVYYLVDVQLTNSTYFKTAYTNNVFGRNITQSSLSMAETNHAILAITDDYYGFRDTGLILRNGFLYRDITRSDPDNQALLVNQMGDFSIITEGSVSGNDLIAQGIQESFSFGPVLVQDWLVHSCKISFFSTSSNPAKTMKLPDLRIVC